MRAMKDSGIEWIGKIPQDWQIAKVKHVYSFQTGWTPSTSNAAYFDGDLPWANISDIGKTKTIYDTAKHITEEAVANSSMGISPKGSLMYSFKLSVGDVSFCGTDMYTNEAIATFLPSDKYDLRYLYYAAPLFIIKNANENIYGAKLLNQELIRNALILNPPYNEQVSVADYLDAKCAEIDALIAAKEKTNTLLKERRQSIIYEAVTKGLNPNAPMKDSGVEWIGEIPEEWETRRIKYCFDVFAGATPKSGNSEFWDGDVVWVTPADYTTEQKYITQGRKYITQEGFESCSTELIPAGSLIFSKRAPIGLVAINMVELCTNQGCLSCVPKDGNDVEYFYYAFSCFAEQFDLYGSGTTFKEISADAFVNFPIPFPSTEEQKEISEHLRIKCSELDTLISANEATIQKLKEYRQSIIYEAVTGKIEV